MQTSSETNLLIAGSIGLDTIETPFGKAENVLGGSATHASLAASFFCKAGIVAVAGVDFTEAHRKIYEDAKINLDGLQISPGKTFRWGGKYDFNLNNRETLFTELNVMESFNPLLPQSCASAEYIFLGNLHPGLQLQILSQLKKPKFVGLDTMNFWIEGAGERLQEVLGKINALIINDSEARELTKEYNIHKAARKILAMMSGEKNPLLIIKRGEYGLMMFSQAQVFFLPAFPLEEVFDPTGAGDSFAGGFMGYLAASNNFSWNNLKKASVAGSCLASFCVEKMGVEGLLNVTQEKIKTRLEQFKLLTEFDVSAE